MKRVWMLAACVAAIGMTGCSNDEESVELVKDGTATIELSGQSDNMVTKAASDLPAGSQIGVSFFKGDALNGTANLLFTPNGSSLTTTEEVPSWVTNDIATVYAYAPKKDFKAGGYSIEATRGTDYLYAKSVATTLAEGKNTVDLTFKHAGSQFKLQLVKSKENAPAISDEDLAKVTLEKVAGLNPSGIFETQTGIFSSLAPATDLTPATPPVVNGMSAINILPTNGSTTLTFTFKGDWNAKGSGQEEEIEGTLSRDFKPGESYLITVTVNATGTTIPATLSLNATLQDWITVTEGIDIVEPAAE